MKTLNKKDLERAQGGCLISLAAGICIGMAADRLYERYQPLSYLNFFRSHSDDSGSPEEENA